MYQSARLKKFPSIIHGFSEKKDGNMSFHFGLKEEVLKNRENFLNAVGMAARDCVAMEVLHGTEVISVDPVRSRAPRGGRSRPALVGRAASNGVDGAFRGRGLEEITGSIKVDALITATPNLFLFLLTGDCLPIVFYDEKKGFIALAHLSRINTQELFIQKIVGALEKMGSRREDIFVAFGPGILKDSYIFSEDEIKTRIPNQEKWGNFLIRLPDGRIAVDFLGWNIRQLRNAGISEEHIEASGIDTGANENFFSHYRSRKTGEPEGRMATVVGFIE